MTSVKADPKLWANVVKDIKNSPRAGPTGTWNARKAQLAVAEYKAKDGKYVGRKSSNNSLSKWTQENWGYIDGVKGNRYLPANVRKSLTTKEKTTENRLKRNASRKGIQRASYSRSVSAKLSKSRKSRR